MPVFKYRSEGDRLERGAPAKGCETHWRRIAGVWPALILLSRSTPTPGVRGFRSIDETSAAAEGHPGANRPVSTR